MSNPGPKLLSSLKKYHDYLHGKGDMKHKEAGETPESEAKEHSPSFLKKAARKAKRKGKRGGKRR